MAVGHIYLWLSSIPIYMYHIFFIKSSIEGCFSCLHILVIVNIRAHISLRISVFFLLLLKCNCLHFPHHHFHPPQPSPPPTISPTPPWLCLCVLYTCSLTTLPPFPLLSPPTSPLVTLSVFLISMSLVIFCLLVCFVD